MNFRRVETELVRRLRRLMAPGLVAGVAMVGIGLQDLELSDPGPALIDSDTAGIMAEADGVAEDLSVHEPGDEPAEPNVTEPDVAEPAIHERTIAIARGDTLMEALVKAGADRRDAYEAITALSEHFNPRKLQIGQELSLAFLRADETGERLVSLAVEEDIDRTVMARSDSEAGWQAEVLERPLQRLTMRAAGQIDDSLFLAAERERVPARVIVELIRIFSFDVDFQRDIRGGDGFEVYFERFATPDGRQVREGEILFAQLTLSGKPVALYRYETPESGRVDYYHADGTSARRTLMKTPVDGARLSSRFGSRKHPILGYTRMHKGLDFAAPRGTPIMAAGDGVVERANWYGGYGRYIRIRHNGTYKTAYAHLNAIAKGVSAGARVRQGQIIGYIGTTGRSTGPHLHYEVMRDDKQVNPLSLKLPTGETLKGDVFAAFNSYRSALETEIAAIPLPFEVAKLTE